MDYLWVICPLAGSWKDQASTPSAQVKNQIGNEVSRVPSCHGGTAFKRPSVLHTWARGCCALPPQKPAQSSGASRARYAKASGSLLSPSVCLGFLPSRLCVWIPPLRRCSRRFPCPASVPSNKRTVRKGLLSWCGRRALLTALEPESRQWPPGQALRVHADQETAPSGSRSTAAIPPPPVPELSVLQEALCLCTGDWGRILITRVGFNREIYLIRAIPWQGRSRRSTSQSQALRTPGRAQCALSPQSLRNRPHPQVCEEDRGRGARRRPRAEPFPCPSPAPLASEAQDESSHLDPPRHGPRGLGNARRPEPPRHALPRPETHPWGRLCVPRAPGQVTTSRQIKQGGAGAAGAERPVRSLCALTWDG